MPLKFWMRSSLPVLQSIEVLEPIKSGAGASKWRPRFQEAGTVPRPWEFFPVLVFPSSLCNLRNWLPLYILDYGGSWVIAGYCLLLSKCHCSLGLVLYTDKVISSKNEINYIIQWAAQLGYNDINKGIAQKQPKCPLTREQFGKYSVSIQWDSSHQ